MSDEYLWDRSGLPDPEIARLESMLARYRYRPPRSRAPRRTLTVLSAIAALLAIGTALSVKFRPALSEWSVDGRRASVGQTIETGGAGTTVASEGFGEISLEPNSRLEILKSSGDLKQLALRRGTLHATIWAPPSRFVVQTPWAATIDLGCSYTLTVLDDDSSLLTVQTGWVAFRKDSLDSFIPAGAVCRTRPKLGPGLPYWSESPPAFRDAVSAFDLSGGASGLDRLLNLATDKDALTLWHLIRRGKGPDRDRAVARFAAAMPQADTEGLRAGDANAMDRAWDSLGLGATGLFRTYQARWH